MEAIVVFGYNVDSFNNDISIKLLSQRGLTLSSIMFIK